MSETESQLGFSHKSGERIGSYLLDKELGLGGFAEVWRAFEPNSDRSVAVKMFSDQIVRDPRWSEISEEPKKQPDHERIVPIYYSQLDPDSGPCYLVMKLMEGGTLEQHLSETGRLQAAEALSIVRDVIDGLEYAHNKGIIHCDIKPSNILFNSQRRASLSDFGIAKSKNSRTDKTEIGSVKGTAAYMSPEQAEGAPPTPATDIYSLGTVLYEIVCGRLPFDGSDTAIIIARSKEEPPPLRRMVPDLPERLEKVILNCLNRNLQHRYPDCDSLRKALDWASVGGGVPIDPKPPRFRKYVIGGAIAAALLAGGLGFNHLAPSGAMHWPWHRTKIDKTRTDDSPKPPKPTPKKRDWAHIAFDDPDLSNCGEEEKGCLERKRQSEKLLEVMDWKKADPVLLKDCMGNKDCLAEHQRRNVSKPQITKSDTSGDPTIKVIKVP